MRHSLVALVSLFAFSLLAHADTFETFTLSAVTGFGYLIFPQPSRSATQLFLSGTVTLDLDFNIYTGQGERASVANFSYTDGINTVAFTGTNYTDSTGYPGATEVKLTFAATEPDGTMPLVDLELPTLRSGLLYGYDGGLCTEVTPCSDMFGPANEISSVRVYTPDDNSSQFYNIASGSLTPVVTPEPSSIALLGTGLLGVAALVCKRFS